jgi:GMP synthase (glutamine-hydrolysing)
MKSQRPVDHGILILDYGSQYTMLIARRFREIGIYSEVIDGRSALPPADFKIDGIVLSGGPDSVTESGSRSLEPWVLAANKPLLGICYGMQLMMQHFGGRVRTGKSREYGASTLKLSADMSPPAAAMFYDLPTSQQVWMSHGDDVESLAPDFIEVGRSDGEVCAAVVHKTKPMIGLQFHPEVEHTSLGSLMLKQFVRSVCRTTLNWQASDILNAATASVRETVTDGRVLMAVSGGVDSTVAAVLLNRALGSSKVSTVFVDHGLLREGEREAVISYFRELGITTLNVLDRGELFLSRLSGIDDPETKRKVIGKTFIDVFQEFSDSQKDLHYLGQGTLYPDVIESAGHGAGSKVIKSHHNVGGLPDTLKLKLVEPFRYFFKDEVRVLGRELGIPETILMRHPFPGPGLAIRLLGAINREDIAILRAADYIFIEELRKRGLYDHVWQAFAVLLPVRSVGVMGDNRTYQKTCALRAVLASDGMTAKSADLDMHFLQEVADQIIRKVSGINRVVYDLTGKPPATIEWE